MVTTKATFEPKYLGAFEPYLSKDNYLVCRDCLKCQVVSDQFVFILRLDNNLDTVKADLLVKQHFDVTLPKVGQMSVNKDNIKCLWVSPDEYWFLVNSAQQTHYQTLLAKVNKGLYLIDNSGAYGLLKLSGDGKKTLLARLMSYDLDKLVIGKVVSTTLTQSPVVIFSDEEKGEPVSYLLVRHSFANYVATLIKDVAQRI